MEKTKEEYLREAFTEAEIRKGTTKYPSSTQRPSIYRAMEAYAASKDQRIKELEEELARWESGERNFDQ
jgi:hypothetical protein